MLHCILKLWGGKKLKPGETLNGKIFEVTLQDPAPISGRPLNLMYATSFEGLLTFRDAINRLEKEQATALVEKQKG